MMLVDGCAEHYISKTEIGKEKSSIPHPSAQTREVRRTEPKQAFHIKTFSKTLTDTTTRLFCRTSR
jgi:hypothetical protein